MKQKRARTPKEQLVTRISKAEQWVYARTHDAPESMRNETLSWAVWMAVDVSVTDPMTEATVQVFDSVRERLMGEVDA